ncbi:hypothetical protein D9611_005771 [Ephemerocybe angulata]|uniref:Uncharacterized protein n=1 Tax=Ephemerocybe angulata TaxID=980116 RepID=A0A8H5F4L6_9AGAR|nr:hypothetical protein D9611_005771 [Tulosesus angulatus]
MAAPADLNILDLSGKYVMNKELSDKRIDTMLSLQGVGWIKRKAITLATVTLFVKHFKNEDGFEVVNIDQTISGGIPASSELRTLTGNPRETEDVTFGHIITKSKRVKVDELDVSFLKNGWTADTIEHGLIHSYTESNTPKSGTTWIASQAWGLEEINGERRYTRHIKFTGPKAEDIEAVLVYDYLGPLDS